MAFAPDLSECTVFTVAPFVGLLFTIPNLFAFHSRAKQKQDPSNHRGWIQRTEAKEQQIDSIPLIPSVHQLIIPVAVLCSNPANNFSEFAISSQPWPPELNRPPPPRPNESVANVPTPPVPTVLSKAASASPTAPSVKCAIIRAATRLSNWRDIARRTDPRGRSATPPAALEWPFREESV